jgi:ABC-type multidrug transport system ATPase subunit
MNEIQLAALLEIYGLMEAMFPSLLGKSMKLHVKSYLNKNFSSKVVSEFYEYYLIIINSYAKADLDYDKEIKSISYKLQVGLTYDERIKILIDIINLLKFFDNNLSINTDDKELFKTIKKISHSFSLPESEFEDIYYLIHNKPYKIDSKKIVLYHPGDIPLQSGIKEIFHPELKSSIYFYLLEKTGTFLLYFKGKDKIELSGIPIYDEKIYSISLGGYLKINDSFSIFYNELIRNYTLENNPGRIIFQAEESGCLFEDKKTAIHKFSYQTSSGNFIAIMGNSGVGKTTMLNLLNGTIRPHEGRILINGHDIHKDYEKISGLIGYVPQEDMLFSQLSVWQNILYSASLSLGNLNESQIKKKILKVVNDLEIRDIIDIKVGSKVDKIISGGERKRVNIALELIREPAILFIDEPTTGLSSSDSHKISKLLASLANKGLLVIINIHQPSAEVFKLFDEIIIMEKGGRVTYTGKPFDALNYFQQNSGILPGKREEEYQKKINPENIFSVIEDTVINETGLKNKKRRFTPANWYKIFRYNNKKLTAENKTEIPKIKYTKPSALKQTITFFSRTYSSRIADYQFILIAILISPFLASVLSLFCKYRNSLNDFHYIFSNNPNIPSYLFMSVITMLFIGMVISADSLFSDRQIRIREKFLHLNDHSYLSSKTIFFFLISLFQAFCFTIIGNAILEIKGMLFYYFIILFSVACYSNMVGFLISSFFKSLAAIYFIIPLLIIPQILLGGIVIKYDKIHWMVSSQKNTPIVADFMIARWGFEALMSASYKYNAYNKHYFELLKSESIFSYFGNYLIPVLISDVNDYINKPSEEKQKLINNSIKKIETYLNFNLEDLNTNNSLQIKNTLQKLRYYCHNEFEKVSENKDKISELLISELGGQDKFYNLKSSHHNKKIEDIVLNHDDLKKIVKGKNEYIRKSDPGLFTPENKLFRAHLYSPVKNFGNWQIETIAFNLVIIWLNIVLLYFVVIALLRKTN